MCVNYAIQNNLVKHIPRIWESVSSKDIFENYFLNDLDYALNIATRLFYL